MPACTSHHLGPGLCGGPGVYITLLSWAALRLADTIPQRGPPLCAPSALRGALGGATMTTPGARAQQHGEDRKSSCSAHRLLSWGRSLLPMLRLFPLRPVPRASPLVVKHLLGCGGACFKYVAGTTPLNLSVFEVSTALSIRSACLNVVAKLESTTLHRFERRYYLATAVSATTSRHRQNNI